MESRNRLGIYLRKDRATVVCLAGQGAGKKLIEAFTITAEEEDLPSLVDRVAAACIERGIKDAEASVALDCALFMQHSIHSEFVDYKKIAATVRFDTEEALATDVSNMAVSFRIVSTDDEGANLDVFTADRNVLSDILLSLQANGIDPVFVDPDICRLSRYLSENGASNRLPEGGALCALLSDSRGYLVGAANSHEASTMRAFLVGPGQDRKGLLGREVLVTAALGGGQDGQRLCVLDAGSGLTAQDLAQSVPLPAQDCDLAGLQGVTAQDMENCDNVVDFAIAYGAALPESEKENGANFRNDHMPYLGEKRRQDKALRFLSISLTILLLTLGIAAQAKLMRINRDRVAVREKIEPDYLAIMPNKDEVPDSMVATVKSLESVKRRIIAMSGPGSGDTQSIEVRLFMVLYGINACAAETDLSIDTVNLTSKSISINGDTSSRANTLKVFDAMDKAGLSLKENRYEEEGKRDAFNITAEPKKQPKRD